MSSLRITAPMVSVIMPTWNCAAFVSEAVRSILEQTYSNFELLLVDGGSADATIEIIRQFSDKRLRLLHAKPGIVAALNLGLNEARGEWIARQDADDISLPNRLERQVMTVGKTADCVLCYTDDKLFGDIPPDAKRARFTHTQALLALKLCYQCPVVHSSTMFLKKAVKGCGGYRGEQAEDYDLWGRLIQSGVSIGLGEQLVMTRRHPVSASKRHAATMALLAQEISHRHCMQFMELSGSDATRAHCALSGHGTRAGLAEWRWFLCNCLPRLKWKSLEMYAWVLWQTVKALAQSRNTR
jgi:glycosyltransferase involved in cell wall biosynthesis